MIRVLHGDCRTILPTLDAGSVQCVVTSPPYYGLRNYGVDGQIGLEPTPDEYVAQMAAVFGAVRRVLRDDGTVWLNLGDSYAGGGNGGGGSFAIDGVRGARVGADKNAVMRTGARGCGGALKPKDLLGIPWRVAFALQADGWWLRSAIVWSKPNPMPEPVNDRPTSSYEMVFLLTNSKRYFYDADAVREPFTDDRMGNPGAYSRTTQKAKGANNGRADGGFLNHGGGWNADGGATGRNLCNVWTIAPQPYSGAHFATMPPPLAARCIKAGTSARGCCPKCGAAWTRVVERGEADLEHQRACGGDASGAYNGKSHKGHATTGVQDASAVKARILAGMIEKTTVGWRPSCDCPSRDPVPCVVLDPFGGAGTTGIAADRLDRDAILIELNPEYCAAAKDRVRGDSPLFAEVVAS